MAGRRGVAIVENVSVSTLQTLIQLLAAANHPVEIKQIAVSGAGTSSTAEPIDVTVIRQADAGTASALTPVKFDDSCGENILTTAQKTFTAEPTPGDLVFSFHVHPQTGVIWNPPVPLIIGGGDRMGLRVLAGSAVAVNAMIVFEE